MDVSKTNPLHKEAKKSLLKTDLNWRRPTHFYPILAQSIVIAGGAVFWKYSKRWDGKFKIRNEGGFKQDSNNGGSDKVGHFYTWWVLTRVTLAYYESQNISKKEIFFWGTFWPILNGILTETLDGFTTYGSSVEDLASNVLGSLVAGYLYQAPNLDKLFQINWSYFPSSEYDGDPTTDYSGSLVTFDINLKEARKQLGLNDTYLDNFLLGISYFSRGYRTNNEGRYLGLTLGLNVPELLPNKMIYSKKFFKYYKLPLTFVGIYANLNKKNKFEFFGAIKFFIF